MKPITAHVPSGSTASPLGPGASRPLSSPEITHSIDKSAGTVSDEPAGSDAAVERLWSERESLCCCDSAAEFCRRLAQLLTEADESAYCGWHDPAEADGSTAEGLSLSFAVESSICLPFQDEMQQAAALCLQDRSEVIRRSTVTADASVRAILLEGERDIVVVVRQRQQMISVSLTRVIQLLFAEWSMHQQMHASQRVSKQIAAIAEIMGEVQAEDDAESASVRLSERLRSFLGADRVAIGLCRAGSRRCTLAALSEPQETSASDEESAWMESVLQESIARGESAVLPQAEDENRHALLSHQQLMRRMQLNGLVTCPITTDKGHTAGSIAVMYGSQEEADGHCQKTHRAAQEARQFLDAVSRPLAGCLTGIQNLADSWFLNGIRRIRRSMSEHRRVVLLGAGLVVLALTLIPWPYRVGCECQLQPTTRRFIAAPFDAPLLKCDVQPGDVVESGQLLAELDGREIRWELASVDAELNRAQKERNTYLSTHQSAEAAIALHEVERLSHRAELLRSRAQHLEIRSPIAGVVVAGDHEDSEGVPLEMGQSLFEIAPLDNMIVELELPEEDIRHVSEGMAFRVQWNSDPAHPVTGEILRIHPRAELRQNQNVFIAEAELENIQGRFRPGMRGHASVDTGLQPLGWNLFHKPAAYLCGWMGW